MRSFYAPDTVQITGETEVDNTVSAHMAFALLKYTVCQYKVGQIINNMQFIKKKAKRGEKRINGANTPLKLYPN